MTAYGGCKYRAARERGVMGGERLRAREGRGLLLLCAKGIENHRRQGGVDLETEKCIKGSIMKTPNILQDFSHSCFSRTVSIPFFFYDSS